MWFYQDTDNIGNIDIWSQRIDLKKQVKRVHHN